MTIIWMYENPSDPDTAYLSFPSYSKKRKQEVNGENTQKASRKGENCVISVGKKDTCNIDEESRKMNNIRDVN